MKIGKLPEQMLVRSVLKQAKHRRDEVLVGPAVGQDCAVMELGPDEVFVMSSDPITGTVKDIGSHGIHVTANDLAASGAEPVGVILTVLLPENIEEEQIRKMMQDAERTCKELNMEIMGGHTEITNVVQQPLLTVTGVGKTKKKGTADHDAGTSWTGYRCDKMDRSGGNVHSGKRKRRRTFTTF